MGEAGAFLDLDRVLKSRPEKLKPEEENVLLTCKSKVVSESMSSALFGATAVWIATWKLKNFVRLNLTAGAFTVFAKWTFDRSLGSCLDHILSMDGSRMQKELANIIANRYRDDPRTMQHMNQHFYTEKVFDDSCSDMPILRFRHRNFFGDNAAYGQRMNDSDFHNDSDGKKLDVESKHIPMNSGVSMMEDPLDSILGYVAPVEEIHHPSTSSTPDRAVAHRHRRSQRKRRMHHHEVSLSLKHSQPEHASS